jgi:hypothetical protein
VLCNLEEQQTAKRDADRPEDEGIKDVEHQTKLHVSTKLIFATTRRGTSNSPTRELRVAISKNNQQDSARPTGQETKRVSTSDIKPDSLLPRRRRNL